MFAVFTTRGLVLSDSSLSMLAAHAGRSSFDWRQRLVPAPDLPRVVDLLNDRTAAEALRIALVEVGADARVAEVRQIEHLAHSTISLRELAVEDGGLSVLSTDGASTYVPFTDVLAAISVRHTTQGTPAAARSRSILAPRFGIGEAVASGTPSKMETFLVLAVRSGPALVVRSTTRLAGLGGSVRTTIEGHRLLMQALAAGVPDLVTATSYEHLAKPPGIAVAGALDAASGAALSAALHQLAASPAGPETPVMPPAGPPVVVRESPATPVDPSSEMAAVGQPPAPGSARLSLACRSCGATIDAGGDWFRFDGRDRCEGCMRRESPELMVAARFARAQLARSFTFAFSLGAALLGAAVLLVGGEINRFALITGPLMVLLLFGLVRTGRAAFLEDDALVSRAERVHAGTTERFARRPTWLTRVLHLVPYGVTLFHAGVVLAIGSWAVSTGTLDVGSDQRTTHDAEGRRLLEERGAALAAGEKPGMAIAIEEKDRPAVGASRLHARLYRSHDRYFSELQRVASTAGFTYRPPGVDFTTSDLLFVPPSSLHPGALFSAARRDGRIEVVWLDVQRPAGCPPISGGEPRGVLLTLPKEDAPVLLRRVPFTDMSCGKDSPDELTRKAAMPKAVLASGSAVEVLPTGVDAALLAPAPGDVPLPIRTRRPVQGRTDGFNEPRVARSTAELEALLRSVNAWDPGDDEPVAPGETAIVLPLRGQSSEPTPLWAARRGAEVVMALARREYPPACRYQGAVETYRVITVAAGDLPLRFLDVPVAERCREPGGGGPLVLPSPERISSLPSAPLLGSRLQLVEVVPLRDGAFHVEPRVFRSEAALRYGLFKDLSATPESMGLPPIAWDRQQVIRVSRVGGGSDSLRVAWAVERNGDVELAIVLTTPGEGCVEVTSTGPLGLLIVLPRTDGQVQVLDFTMPGPRCAR